MSADTRAAPAAEFDEWEFDEWHEAVSTAFVPLRAATFAPHTFSGGLSTRSVGSLQISDVRGGPVDVRRSPQAIRLADPGYLKVGLQVAGLGAVTQDGREAVLGRGDLALYDTRRPYRLRFEDPFRMLVVMFPHELFGLRGGALGQVTARRVSGFRGVGALLAPFLVRLAAGLDATEVVPSFELSAAVLDLVAAAFSVDAAGAAAAGAVGHRRTLLLSVKAFADERLADPDLSPGVLAEAHHVSVRHLQKLFEAEGTTPTEWIRRRRLEHARRDLADPRLAGLPIGAIAARWALLDFSHFSKLFRAAFGLSPREFRTSQGGGGPASARP